MSKAISTGKSPPSQAAQAPVERVEEVVAGLQKMRPEPNTVIELRVPKMPSRYGKPHVAAGYFDEPRKLAEAALALERGGAQGIYITLNEVNEALLARAYNRVESHLTPTTADHDIVRRIWLPFDIDPVRPAGVSSSAQEIEAARRRAIDLEGWITNELGAAPDLRAFSGNGFHLLSRIDLPNDDNATAMVKGVIETASRRFSDKVVSIDTTVFNAARIWKLPGTLARKGDEVPRLGRVHRRAVLLDALDAEVTGA